VEEEHQTWYFFTSTFFVIIFFEKSALFYTRKKQSDSDLPEANAVHPENVENQKSRKYTRKERPLDRGKEFRNAEFCNDCDVFTDANLIDGLASQKEENKKTITRAKVHLSREATDKMATENGVLLYCFVVLFLLGFGRLSRVWNQTGIKWADRPDIGDWLVKPENKAMLSLSYFVSLFFIICFRYSRQDILTSIVFLIGAAQAYLYRTVTGSLQLPWLPNEPITKGISEAHYTYCCVATIVVWNVIGLCKASKSSERRILFQEFIGKACGSLEGLMSGLLLLEVLLQRPHNTAVLAVFVIQEHILRKLVWTR